MSALIVNLFGGPGVGKSTTAAGGFALLKLHDVECEIITEYAKDLVWEERHKTFGDQQYIFAKQNHRLWRVHDKVDVIVTDCPLMLSPVYGNRYKTGSPEFDNNVVSVTNQYRNYNVLLVRTKKYNENGRNETEDQAKEIDQAVENTLKKFDMTWNLIPANFEGINLITQTIIGDKYLKFRINTGE